MKITDRAQTTPPKPVEKERPKPQPPQKTEQVQKAANQESPKSGTIGRNLDVKA